MEIGDPRRSQRGVTVMSKRCLPKGVTKRPLGGISRLAPSVLLLGYIEFTAWYQCLDLLRKQIKALDEKRATLEFPEASIWDGGHFLSCNSYKIIFFLCFVEIKESRNNWFLMKVQDSVSNSPKKFLLARSRMIRAWKVIEEELQVRKCKSCSHSPTGVPRPRTSISRREKANSWCRRMRSVKNNQATKDVSRWAKS